MKKMKKQVYFYQTVNTMEEFLQLNPPTFKQKVTRLIKKYWIALKYLLK